ncbi:MAG: pyrroline-5-carboxylate reductase [Candidatus Margulisbacteria bacterium]|nr:pyrroline-5-carboxylate reductase [Candidatus Margulisiibacteriota bacterium]
MQNSVCFFGAGNMGEALIKGCLSSVGQNKIGFVESNEQKAEYILKKYGISRIVSLADINNYETLILAIKPQSIPAVITELSSALTKEILVVSIVAGITIGYYQKHFPLNKIIRVMPNTPCLINKGISVISASNKCSQKDASVVEKIFLTTGKVLFMPEDKINAVTALSGSGPAYFYHIADVYATEAVNFGIAYKDALQLITNTMLGAAEMMLQSNNSVDQLITQVRSPGGTTEAALKKLQINELNNIVQASLSAANNRANELSLKE